jgi:DNA polymerase III delta subunit
MLYFLHGTDTYKSRAKLHELLTTLTKKRPDSEVFKITSENWSDVQFEELLVSQGLFDQKYIVVLDNLFEKKDVKDFVLDRIDTTKDVEHVFLMLEGKTDAASLKKIEKVAVKVQEFVKPESHKESFNIFGITDSLVRKDKKSLWVTYVDLLGHGAVAEEIHGVLFWQVKNMLLASKASSQQDTGLSPFVYKNALTGARNFTEQELEKFSSQLVDMTHRVRAGDGELEVMMEKWLLTI